MERNLTNEGGVCLFTTWCDSSICQSVLSIDNQPIWVNNTPRLLGVILDRSLAFNGHMKKWTASLTSRLCVIQATVHKYWGWSWSTLKIVVHALICNKFDYAAPAWQSWQFATNLSCLDRLQFPVCSFPISDWLKKLFYHISRKSHVWLIKKVELCPAF